MADAVNPYYVATFVVYLAVVLAVGVWAWTRTRDVMDFWVFGRRMGPLFATTSLVATFVSAVSVIGFVGAVYAEGYALVAHTILGLMLGLSALYFVAGYIRPLDVITFPDLVARVTGRPASRPLAGSILLASGWLYLVMQLVGAGLLVAAVTGLPYAATVWVIGAVFILYTVMGGLVSVVWTDLLQGFLMIAAVLVAFVWMVDHVGGLTALHERLAALDPARLSPTHGGRYTLAAIAASFVAFFGTILTEQDMLIRIAATRDVRTARLHVAAAGVVLSLFYVVLVLLGGAATVALVGAGIAVPTPDAAFPTLVTSYLPTGIGVAVILAAMSAILSTTDTRLHAIGLTVARDLYSYARPAADGDRLLKVSRLATLVLGLSATAAAVNPPGTIITLYGLRAVLLTSAFLVPVYVALFRTDMDGRVVLAAISCGGVVGLAAHLAGGGFGGVPSTFAGTGAAAALLLAGRIVLRPRLA